MSTTDDQTATTGPHGTAQRHTADELRAMTPEERMIAGAETDDIHIVHRRDRFPIRGTKAEKRAERGVAGCFIVAALAGVAFIVYFCAGSWKWHLPGTAQNFRFYTPILGGLLAVLLLFMGLGLVLWAKWLMPEEEVIQERHDYATTEEDKLMSEATLTVGLDDTGLPRRKLILRSRRPAVACRSSTTTGARCLRTTSSPARSRPCSPECGKRTRTGSTA
jgi:ubiquinol-cytochrome c reductase iron-sulfur subunit